eukprot:TRINITY_DN6463_c1_g3_i1.p1 TRINITY_DN6463_c1_g3~~TRINITY_DN6463_c1_g3_i1.p1  ORF type:complete len:323 (-),score=76.26 TRINITY_DN6463_c1_g3_i1:52-1020(-)
MFRSAARCPTVASSSYNRSCESYRHRAVTRPVQQNRDHAKIIRNPITSSHRNYTDPTIPERPLDPKASIKTSVPYKSTPRALPLVNPQDARQQEQLLRMIEKNMMPQDMSDPKNRPFGYTFFKFLIGPVAYVFCGICFIAGLWCSYCLYIGGASESWLPTTAIIETAHPVSWSPGRPAIQDFSYKYTVDGVQHIGTRFRIGEPFLHTQPFAPKYFYALTPGEEIPIFFNPNNPAQATVLTGVDKPLRWFIPALISPIFFAIYFHLSDKALKANQAIRQTEALKTMSPAERERIAAAEKKLYELRRSVYGEKVADDQTKGGST